MLLWAVALLGVSALYVGADYWLSRAWRAAFRFIRPDETL